MQLKTFLHRLNVWRSLDPCLGIWQFFLKGNPFTPLFSPRFFSSFFFCILFPFHVNLFFHFGHIGFRSGYPSSSSYMFLFSYPSSYSSGYASTYPYGYLSSFPSNFGLVYYPVFHPLYYTIFHLVLYFWVFPWIKIQMGLSYPVWHSSFINCFNGSLQCKFIWTLFYYLIPFSCYLLLFYIKNLPKTFMTGAHSYLSSKCPCAYKGFDIPFQPRSSKKQTFEYCHSLLFSEKSTWFW